MIQNIWFVMGWPLLLLGTLAGMIWGTLLFGYSRGMTIILDMVRREGEKKENEAT